MSGKIRKIIEYALKIKEECKDRSELLNRVAKKFGVKPITVNFYLVQFSTESEKEKLKFERGRPSYFDVVKMVLEKPRFGSELTRREFGIARYLVKKGVLKQIRLKNRKIVFYVKGQEMIVYEMLKGMFYLKRNLLRALGIPITIRNGRYFHKETNKLLSEKKYKTE